MIFLSLSDTTFTSRGRSVPTYPRPDISHSLVQTRNVPELLAASTPRAELSWVGMSWDEFQVSMMLFELHGASVSSVCGVCVCFFRLAFKKRCSLSSSSSNSTESWCLENCNASKRPFQVLLEQMDDSYSVSDVGHSIYLSLFFYPIWSSCCNLPSHNTHIKSESTSCWERTVQWKWWKMETEVVGCQGGAVMWRDSMDGWPKHLNQYVQERCLLEQGL